MLFTFSVSAPAQSAGASGTISGKVVDPRGAVVAGAKVTLRNTDFGNERAVVSDSSGGFTFVLLPSGNYAVQVAMPGFALKKAPRITLGVGSSVRVELRLAVAAASTEVTVTGRGGALEQEGNTLPPAVNKEESEASNTIAGLNVTYLPNRIRDVSQFGELAAGANAENPNGSGVAIAGQRAEALNGAVDGAVFRDPLQGGLRGAHDQTLFLPQTVVKEFQIVHSGVSAEVGETNAGFLNIATKSGSNKPHGEAFYIGRPSLLSSEDAFGHSLDNTQNEFGGSLGGPIKKDKAFYYFGVEQDYLHTPYWTEFQAQAPGVGVPAALIGLQRQVVGKSNPLALSGRSDFNLNAASTLNVELNYNHASASNFMGETSWTGSARSIAAFTNGESLRGDSVWARANLTSSLNPASVNQLLLGWAQDHRDFAPASIAPEIAINGFGVLGGSSLSPLRYASRQLQLSDDVELVRGAHLLHLGGNFDFDPVRQQQEANLNGRYDFNSLADYLAGRVRRYQQTFVTGDGVFDASVHNSGAYVSDRWTINPRLTLNAGLRWEGQWNPGFGGIPNDLAQWQPRLGLAWNPAAKTVVRLSSGLYDAPTPANTFQRIFTDNGMNTRMVDSYYDPEVLPLVASGNAFAALPPELTAPAALVVGIAPNFRNVRSFQAAASVEQQFTPRLSASAGYVRNSTWELQRMVNTNLNAPVYNMAGLPIFPAARPDPAIGQLLTNQSDGHSSYDGLLLTANWQFGKRSNLTANYTFSHSRDDVSYFGPFGPLQALDPFNLHGDSAASNFDVRHNFNLSAIFNMPYGFKLNPLIVTRSGMPYTPTLGFDTQNDGNDANDRALLNGQLAARNSLRQPAFFNLDLRLVKDITLPGEGHHL
ncbi:MAG: TonB-dependent receptor, partial [Acidobacteriaceae bacterium]